MSTRGPLDGRQPGERQQPAATLGGHADQPSPPVAWAAQHGARVLDPLTATRLAGDPPPRPTAYLADRLLVVQDHRAGRAHALVTKAAGRLGLEVRPDQRAERLRGQLDQDPAALVVASITLVPAASTIPVAAPDAWSVLVTARALAADAGAEDVEALGAVCLDHLLAGVGPDVAGLPHTEGHGTEGLPHTEGHGTGGYTRPGTGGRQPVSWLGPAPRRGDPPPSGRRRPVVAVLDTGCAPHPWLDDAVDRDVRLGAQPAGDVDPATDPEVGGDLTGPLDGALDSHSGHGTFISGLLRQLCPQADLLAVRVMSSSGAVRESDLLHALAVLTELVRRHHDGLADGRPADVLVLSLGYHHEQPDDAAFDAPLLEALRRLGRLGVLVVAAAGNGATRRPMYPAAFAPWPASPFPPEPGCLPVVSVGATNPDGSVALFSNAGPWVTTWQPGAALVATMPTTFRGGGQPTVAYPAPDGSRRAALDPDDFSGGFGVWSGTSFAAPVLAGRAAARLWQDSGGQGLLDDGVGPALARGEAVLAALTQEGT